MIPVPVEPGNTKSLWAFKDMPGMVQMADAGAAIRGSRTVGRRAFWVAGNTLYEQAADGSLTTRGGLTTNTGWVGMTDNTTQLVLSDGVSIYSLVLATNVWSAQAFVGKARIDYINQRIVFVIRETQQFGWTDLAATSINALSFASAESSPDKLVGVIVDHREVILGGEDSFEDWLNTGSTAVFERNQGVAIEEGLAAEFTLQKLRGSVYWLASSSRGQGSVVRLNGYQPSQVSTQAIEEMLSGKDLSQASAFTIESEKSAFYCLNVPGLETTLVYDDLTGQWHERAELVNGLMVPWRATSHLFAFGYHIVGSDSGKLYRLDTSVANNAGDPLLRERVMPASATPMRDRIKYERFALDCDRGTGGKVQMRYSIDGGRNWSEWKIRSLGEIGVFNRSVQWKRLGGGKDLIVRIRCTDNVPFNPVSGVAQ